MNVFVGGTRTLKTLDKTARAKILAIVKKGYRILVGDCYGIDTAVQQFLFDLGYRNVSVFATNGCARNNVGNWPIVSVPAGQNVTGFEYYQVKDIAMAKEADCGFMIWDSKSRGTLNNVINLVGDNKTVLLYLPLANEQLVFMSLQELHNKFGEQFINEYLQCRAEESYEQNNGRGC